MQIFVKTPNSSYLCLEVSSGDTVWSIKRQIEAREGVRACDQALSHTCRPLRDQRSIADYGLRDDDTIDLNLRLLGGAKKRKKKNYSTPKKTKHKKKRVKMSTLRFYKVDDKGKITRLRRECVNGECGAGVFMADHFDRQYCGRCGATYTFKKRKHK